MLSSLHVCRIFGQKCSLSGYELPTSDELQAVLRDIIPRERRHDAYHPHAPRANAPQRKPFAERLRDGTCQIATSTWGVTGAISLGMQLANRQARPQDLPKDFDPMGEANTARMTNYIAQNLFNAAVSGYRLDSVGNGWLGSPQGARRDLINLMSFMSS